MAPGHMDTAEQAWGVSFSVFQDMPSILPSFILTSPTHCLLLPTWPSSFLTLFIVGRRLEGKAQSSSSGRRKWRLGLQEREPTVEGQCGVGISVCACLWFQVQCGSETEGGVENS